MNWEGAWAHFGGSFLIAAIAFVHFRYPHIFISGKRVIPFFTPVARSLWRSWGVDDPDSPEGYRFILGEGLALALVAVAFFVISIVELTTLAMHRA